MSDKNKTLYQRLNNVFTNTGIKVKDKEISKYNIDDRELLRTTDKDEYELAKKQALQTAYLKNQWVKVENEMFHKSIHQEATRVGSYSDFEAMEYYPEIAAALDIFSEESCTVNEHGKVLNIYSDSKRVEAILDDLFFNRLDIHTTLHMWVRNVCKLGDNFVYLNIDDNEGVLGCKQLPNYEIERREVDFADTLKDSSLRKDNSTKFIWRGKNIEFNPWQIAHFRLLSDDRKLPYGSSILEKCRKIWKELVLMEDAMMVYRITRAPERRVFKIYVGNIDDEDVPAYVNQIANRFKRTPVIDPKTGQIDTKYNQYAYDQDYIVPVRTENAPNPIDTLPGAQNLSDIGDIEFLQRKLFTALRVPKSFLGFDDAVGEGKNLALQDIRFTRTVNRIQQAIIMELNKIAIIHLYLLGFEDDLENFSITMNNPSTQAEMLKIEHWQKRITLYQEAVRDSGNGFGAMSMTKAKREILGMTSDDIKHDLLEQRMEKAAAAELEQTASVIKKTGFFDVVDNIYGIPESERNGEDGGDGSEGNDKGGPSGGGGFGVADSFDGEGFDLGEDGADEENTGGEPDQGGEGETETGDAGTEGEAPEEFGGKQESFFNKSDKDKLLTEKHNLLSKKLTERTERFKAIYTDKLIKSVDRYVNDDNIMNYKNSNINEGITSMINDIDKLIKE